MMPPEGTDRSQRLRKALPRVSEAVKVPQADYTNLWNDLRYGFTDLKKEPGLLECMQLPSAESIDDVWELLLILMSSKPKYTRQTLEVVSMLLLSPRWASGILRAKERWRLSLWKLKADAGSQISPVELASDLIKFGVPIDQLLPASALASDTGISFVEVLIARLDNQDRVAFEGSSLGEALQEVRKRQTASAMNSSSRTFTHRTSSEDLGRLTEANQAQAATIEAAGQNDRRLGCRKDVVDSLLDLTEEALEIAERGLRPMMSGYAGEVNIATVAKGKLYELRNRQADLQAQLVILGPCQAGKTSLTHSLVGFAALAPSTPSMVTARWVHTPNLVVPKLTMPEVLAHRLRAWSERMSPEESTSRIVDLARAVEGTDAVAEALAEVHRLIYYGRTQGLIEARELELLSRPSSCMNIEVAFSALANLEDSLSDCGTLSVVDLPSPDCDLLWDDQDLHQLHRSWLQEADGVLVVVDASEHQTPRWLISLLGETFLQDHLLRKEDTWVVANQIDRMPSFFCKDGVTKACRQVKACQHSNFQNIILGEDRVIPTAALLSLLAMYGSRKILGSSSLETLASFEREEWFARLSAFLFGVHWESKVRDVDRQKWRQYMQELQLMGQVTGSIANSVLKTAYLKMLPRSVARVMFELSQLITSFVSALLLLEGDGKPVDVEKLSWVFDSYLEDVHGRIFGRFAQHALSEEDVRRVAASRAAVVFEDADAAHMTQSCFALLAREAISLWQPNFIQAVTSCCSEANDAHAKWQRSLDYYLTQGGVDAATRQNVLFNSKNVQFSLQAEGLPPLENSQRDKIAMEYARKVPATESRQLFQRTKKRYAITQDNIKEFLFQLRNVWNQTCEENVIRRCIDPIQANFDEMMRNIKELNKERADGSRRRKTQKSFDLTFARRLAEVLHKVTSFSSEQANDERLDAVEAQRCEQLVLEVRETLRSVEKML